MTAKQALTSHDNKSEEREEKLALMEAALYVAGRPLDLKTLSSILKTRSKRTVQALTRELMRRYLERKGALRFRHRSPPSLRYPRTAVGRWT